MSELIRIFDTTLRDGEQSAGASLSLQDKIRIARQLERLNVDVIEAGYPAASPGQMEAVHAICSEVGKTVAALARARSEDIEAAGRALSDAQTSRIHTFIGTSDYHIVGKFGSDRYGRSLSDKRRTVLRMTRDAVSLASEVCDEVEFSAEDALRTDFEYLVEVIETALAAGAVIINVPDTTGFAHPAHYGQVMGELRKRIPALGKVMLSAHCHDDLGLAVANTLAAIQNGARQVECTVNGIGERAGNASLEEIVMILNVRGDAFPFQTSIQTEELYATSRLVSAATGMLVQPNKAIVGQNAFAHESGIHQDGVLKKRETYEIMDPRSVGVDGTRISLGKNSGRHGLKHRLRCLGCEVDDERISEIYERFLLVADQKKQVEDEDLWTIVGALHSVAEDRYELEEIQVLTGNGSPSSATIVLKKRDRVQKGAAFGEGPIEASFSAIDRILSLRPVLEHYQVHSSAPGMQSPGVARVRLRDGSRVCVGRGESVDIIEASVRAYLDACNHLLALRSKQLRQFPRADDSEELKTSLAW